MNKNIFKIISFTITFIFISISYPQVIEKNGIYFNNFQLNPDNPSVAADNFTGFQKTFSSEELNRDTMNIPSLKNDFMVNSLDGDYGADQYSVSSAIDGNGNYAFAWLDFRNGVKDIYAQFYNNNDEKIGINFKVNKNKITGNNAPFIAANRNGDFIITWLQDFNYAAAQKYTKDGREIGEPVIVNYTRGTNTMEPSAAMNEDGSFMVMWASEKGDWQYQLYARLFDSFCIPLTSEILINSPDYGPTSIGQGKHIAIDGKGNYCITWSSSGTDNISDIYLQMLNNAGEKFGDNRIVSNLSDSSDKYFPQVVSTDDGHFLITWDNYPKYLQTDRIGANIFYLNNFISADISLYNSVSGNWNSLNLSSDKDSTFYLLFQNNGVEYFQKLKSSGEFIGDTIRVKFNLENQFYYYTAGLMNVYKNHFYVAPQVYQRTDQNIYLQKFDTMLAPVGIAAKINDDYGSSSQRNSTVKFNNKGESIIIWEDGRNGNKDLYAQVYDKDFNPVGENIQVNDSASFNDKKIQCLSDGTFVIAFGGSANNNYPNIYIQPISTSGKKLGKNRWVKYDNYYSPFNIAMNINSNDDILLCWYNRYGAYLKKYNKDFTPLTTLNNFIKSKSPYSYNQFAISIDSSFNIFAVWKEYNFETNLYDNKVKGNFFDEIGKSTSQIFIIDSAGYDLYNFHCQNENKNFVFLYQRYNTIHLKRKYNFDKEYTFENLFYTNGGAPLQANIAVFNNQKVFITYNSSSNVLGFFANDNKRKTELFNLYTYDYINPPYEENNEINSADIFQNKLIFTFDSNKNGGTGYDVWANVKKIEDVSFSKETFFAPVNYDILYQNYPNPFNPKTTITYELLAYHKVKLAIYDLLGRELKVLVDVNQEKGLYQVEFDSSNLASGIYFYRLEAFNTIVKKMIILK